MPILALVDIATLLERTKAVEQQAASQDCMIESHEWRLQMCGDEMSVAIPKNCASLAD